MIRLHQTFGAHTGRSYSFDQLVVRLGRMPDSDVAFDPHADLDASGRHAEIRREGAEWVVVDVGSRNGTFVAGQRITRHPLRNGDEIECGPGGPRLRVELADAPRAPSYPSPIVRPDAATVASTPVGEAPSHGLPGTVPPPAHPPQTAPPPAPSFAQPKLYGRETVGLMIEEAVGRARETEQVPGRRLLIGVVVGLAAVLAIMLVVLLVLVLGARRSGPDPAHVAAANGAALYRVVRISSEETLCTAFAIRRRVLATTATCVLAIEASRDDGIELRGPTAVRPRQLWRHPSHVQGQLGPDVGLLELDLDLPAVVTLTPPNADASPARRGQALLAYGFAGALARTVAIEVDDVDVRSDGTRLLRYDEAAPDGAPLFDTSGSVVGVHVAGEQSFAVGAETILALLAGLPSQAP
ncbi:MAG: FHA domain-containing protein [Myxococcales bacterium]|nr:FHA domain-containing protein [Myxococcales bacterium]